MIWQYDAMHNVRERVRESGSIANTEICFEVHTTLHPRLHTEGFPLTRPYGTSHTGKPPLRIWANTIWEYTTPLSNKYNLSLEARHKTNHLYT